MKLFAFALFASAVIGQTTYNVQTCVPGQMCQDSQVTVTKQQGADTSIYNNIRSYSDMYNAAQASAAQAAAVNPGISVWEQGQIEKRAAKRAWQIAHADEISACSEKKYRELLSSGKSANKAWKKANKFCGN